MDGKEQDNADAKSETSESSVVSRLSFSKVVSVLPLYSKFTRALTFQNLCPERKASKPPRSEQKEARSPKVPRSA